MYKISDEHSNNRSYANYESVNVSLNVTCYKFYSLKTILYNYISLQIKLAVVIFVS